MRRLIMGDLRVWIKIYPDFRSPEVGISVDSQPLMKEEATMWWLTQRKYICVHGM